MGTARKLFPFRSIRWRILLIYVLLVLLAMEVAGTFLIASLDRYYLSSFTTNLTAQGELLGSFLDRYLADPGKTIDLSPLIAEFGSLSGVSTVVVDRYDKVVGTSGQPESEMGKKFQSPIMTAALAGKRGQIFSPSSGGQNNLVLALPIRYQGQLVGAVELSQSLGPVYRTIDHVRNLLVLATLLAMALTIGLGLFFSQLITRPIREITSHAADLAAGRFTTVSGPMSEDEVGRLRHMFNYLSDRLRETLGAIQSEKTKLEAVLNHMSDGVVAVDADDRVTLMNPMAQHALSPQLPSEGRSLADFPELSRALAEQEETLVLSPDQHPGTYRLVVSPLGSGSGRVIVLQDITQQVRLEAMRKEFVADVSHELRTPLTTVKSYLETLLTERRLKKELSRRFLSVALSETDRMAHLVSDLLTLSQLERGGMPLELRPLEVNDLIAETQSRLHPEMARKNQTVVVTIEPGTPPVVGDKDRVAQALLNVVGNAVEFSPEGGCIYIGARRLEGQVEISVRDEGIGIPAKDIPRIFERFYRVDKGRSRQLGGTGLGLSITKEIVEAHGGTIRLDSAPGRGTIVAFTLPVES